MQTCKLQDLSTVKAPSPLGRRQSTFTQNTDQLDSILHSVRQQIQRWGSDAKWKIDLVLTEPGSSLKTDTPPPQHHQQPLPLLTSPAPIPQQQQRPTSLSPTKKTPDYSLPVSTNAQFPWDYIAPFHDDWSSRSNEELEHMLREVLEKNQQLKNIVHSQAEQIRYSHPLPSDTEKVIDTMKQVYTMSENEQKLNYNTETRMLHKDIQALSRRLLNLKQILQSIEDMELLPEDQKLNKEELLEDRKNLLRKLHLAHLRLKAREAELDYFQDILKQSSFKYDTLHTNHTTSTSPNHNSSSSKPSSSTSPKATHHKSPRFTDSPRNRPYLFQQQYSPKMRSNIRPATAISGLDSLGILADQMLSDPNFESSQQVSPSSPSSNMTSTSAFKKVSQQQKQFQQNDNNNNNSNTEKLKRQQQLQQHIYQQQQALKRSLPKRHLYSIYARGTGGRYYEESDDDNNSNTNDDMDDDQARYNEKRSKRSIDSANTLLSMFPTKPKNSNEDVVMKEDKGTNERPKSKLAYVRWTPEEDQLLRRAVEMNGTSNWDKVANMVTDRSSQQCRQRWSKYLDQKSTTTTISSPVSSPIIMTSSSPSSSKLPPSSFHSPSSKDARHSPSIAALLNTTTIEEEKSHSK